MKDMILLATASFGLEAVVKREIEALGYEVTASADGRVEFRGDETAVARANLWLRCADRVYLKLAEFRAEEFIDLIRASERVAWEDYLPCDGRFIVVGTSVRSKLHSVPACQATIKKAIVNRLMKAFHTDVIPESGAVFTVRFMFQKDICTLLLDASGDGLHKRGYRVKDVAAPIKETLAAAMVQLSFFKAGRFMADPFCGSGTIPIEAALIARNIAPGLSRSFAAENWPFIPKEVWQEARKAAYAAIDYSADVRIAASDIDKRAVAAAKANAQEAGVDDCISFEAAPFSAFERGMEDRGIVICNPPYGMRIGEQQQLDRIYRELAGFFKKNPDWSLFLITADKTFEKKFGRPADRRRKLYNGRIETCYYQYHGKK